MKDRYRLSDLLRAQRTDGLTSNLKRWIENGAVKKGDLEVESTGCTKSETSFIFLTFFYPKYEGRKTASQTYVRDVMKKQQEVNDLCRQNTQQAQVKQKKKDN